MAGSIPGPTLLENLHANMPKKFQVIKATTKEISGLTVGGRPKKFQSNGTFETNDPGEAAEIDKVLGAKGTGEVVVTPYKETEPGHTYTFGPSRQFANAWDAMMDRRKAKESKPGKKRKRRRSRVEVRDAKKI
jgi:hypothetical protein